MKVTVCVSPTFYRCVFEFAGDIKVLGPQDVLDEYRNRLT